MAFESSLLPVVDEIAALFTLPTDWSLDATAARPAKYAPDTVYVFPRTQPYTGEGDGQLDLGRFRIRVAWSSAGGGEAVAWERLRAISVILDDGIEEVIDKVRANRTSTTYQGLEVELVTYDAVVTFDVRAAWVDLAGWRIIGP